MSSPEETGKRTAERAIKYAGQLLGLATIKHEARRRTACAQRTEQQIRAIVRDELASYFAPDRAARVKAHDDLRDILGLPPLTSDGGAR